MSLGWAVQVKGQDRNDFSDFAICGAKSIQIDQSQASTLQKAASADDEVMTIIRADVKEL